MTQSPHSQDSRSQQLLAVGELVRRRAVQGAVLALGVEPVHQPAQVLAHSLDLGQCQFPCQHQCHSHSKDGPCLFPCLCQCLLPCPSQETVALGLVGRCRHRQADVN